MVAQSAVSSTWPGSPEAEVSPKVLLRPQERGSGGTRRRDAVFLRLEAGGFSRAEGHLVEEERSACQGSFCPSPCPRPPSPALNPDAPSSRVRSLFLKTRHTLNV